MFQFDSFARNAMLSIVRLGISRKSCIVPVYRSINEGMPPNPI